MYIICIHITYSYNSRHISDIRLRSAYSTSSPIVVLATLVLLYTTPLSIYS